jgi:DNA-binding NarL/FixJ family response regulator
MVVDNQTLFRSGLVRILEEDPRLAVVAISPGGPDVPKACAALSIDVLVTDLEPANLDGIELTRLVGATAPGARVLILTEVVDSRVLPALASGAAGFMLKDSEPEAIRSAVVSVFLGGHVLCPEAAQWLIGAAGADRGPGRHQGLTQRETEVLQMVAAGVGNRDIAKFLHVNDKTVRNYVSQLYRKLALQNRTQMAMYARHLGLGQRTPAIEAEVK